MCIFNNKAGIGPIKQLDVLEESINQLQDREKGTKSHTSNNRLENQICGPNGVTVQQLPLYIMESYTISISFICLFIWQHLLIDYLLCTSSAGCLFVTTDANNKPSFCPV